MWSPDRLAEQRAVTLRRYYTLVSASEGDPDSLIQEDHARIDRSLPRIFDPSVVRSEHLSYQTRFGRPLVLHVDQLLVESPFIPEDSIVDVTRTQGAILAKLIERADNKVRHRDLIEAHHEALGLEGIMPGDINSLRVFITSIRRVIGDNSPFGYRLIHPVRGVGYILTDYKDIHPIPNQRPSSLAQIAS